jgi:hypothetical protein
MERKEKVRLKDTKLQRTEKGEGTGMLRDKARHIVDKTINLRRRRRMRTVQQE